jgi:hypothetical protein
VLLVYSFFQNGMEREKNEPTEIIIKTENGQPLIKGLENIIIYKDTFKVKSPDTTLRH